MKSRTSSTSYISGLPGQNEVNISPTIAAMAAKTARHDSLQRLFGVSPTTSEYQYPGKKDFSDIYDSEYNAFAQDQTKSGCQKSQYIIFIGVDEQTFRADFDEVSNRLLKKSCCDYIPARGLILVKMTTEAHEQAYIGLDHFLVAKLTLMDPGLVRELLSPRHADIESNSHQKKADSSYRPKILPPGRSDHWPTVVVESALSESRSKLAADARWWLSESAGDVKAALTIAVQKARREITIEKWELIKRPTRQDEDKRVCEVTRRVTVSQGAVDQPIRVTGGSLEIPFEYLFLRPAGLHEGDIVFDELDLKELATMVWKLHAKI